MSDVIYACSLFVAAIAGYLIREIIAGLQVPPGDLQDVLEAFGVIEQVSIAHGLEIGERAEAAFPDSGNALAVAIVKAADRRGMRQGVLLGFIAGVK